MFHFYNTCLNSFNISSLFSEGIIISSSYNYIIKTINNYTASFFTQFYQQH